LNWSVGKDFDRIREYNPLGRVPTLVLDDGEVLIESSAMLDYLDERVGPKRALLPASGAERRAALRIIALAFGAAEKSRDQIYERTFKPQEKWYQPWIDRCHLQMEGALAELERIASQKGEGQWLVGGRFTRADLMVACIFTVLRDALDPQLQKQFPKLAAHVQRCDALPEFRTTYLPWIAPRI
jgi:glutathione S-transferase